MRFDPGSIMFLTLLVLLPLIWWRWFDRRRQAAVRFSSVELLKRDRPTWAVRARHIIPVLRTLAVGLLIVAMARPQKGDEETEIITEGIAIQMLVDRSSSMLAEDFQLNGKRVNRLTAVKSVAREFVKGNRRDNLKGRPNDLIGMIAFAGYADSICPTTLDHDHLIHVLDQVAIAEGRAEDGTAIGDAIALGVERMRALDTRRKAAHANRVKSKVLVLLTDGEQTTGDLTPKQGAELAKALGVKVYTIGVGTEGMAPMPVDFLGQRVLQPTPVSIDEETLKMVAKLTGGEYFRAKDTQSLRRIYARIDELERTDTQEKRYLQYVELATTPVRIGSAEWTCPPILVMVIVLLALEVVLANTKFRRLP